MAADSLHNITVPVTFDVTDSLRIDYTGIHMQSKLFVI